MHRLESLDALLTVAAVLGVGWVLFAGLGFLWLTLKLIMSLVERNNHG